MMLLQKGPSRMLPFYLFVGIILLAIILFLFVIGLSLPGRLLFVIEGKHAVITGGSKGIGRCIAEQLLEEGCKIVSIIARDLEALEKAKNEILQLGFEENSVKIYSCDLNSGQKIIKDLIEKIIADSGPIDLLINNAGTCIQNAFDELPEDAFEKQMKTNFFSAVYMTRAILPQMKERRCGHISFVSSAAGQCAIWGYSAYSPSKFAVRAFADVLYMELLPYEIGVSVLFPPNTATEGFDEELKTMPEQVRQISNSAGVFPPKQVAAALIRSIRMGDFWTCVGLEGKMLGFLSAAASPETNFVNAVMQIFFAGIIRGIMLIYTAQFNAIIKNCYKKIMHGWLSSSSLNFSILIIKYYFLKEILRDIKERTKNWFKWWLTIIKNNNFVVEKDADSNAFINVVDDSSLILSTTTNKEEKNNVNFKQSWRKRRKWWSEKRNIPERDNNNNNAAESIHLQHKADENYFGDNQNLINFDGDRQKQQQQQQKLATTNYFKEEEEYIKKYSYYDNNLPAKKSILKGKNEEEILENEVNLNNKINYSLRKSGGGGGEHQRQFSDDKNLLQRKELRWKSGNNNNTLTTTTKSAATNLNNQKQQNNHQNKFITPTKINNKVDENNNNSEDAFCCCSVCGGRIWSGDKKSAIFGKEELLVHCSCFQCATCGMDLVDTPEEQVFKRDGRFYCQVHGYLIKNNNKNNIEQQQHLNKEEKSKNFNFLNKEKFKNEENQQQQQQLQEEQQQQKEWWERSADEFNGSKKSSTIVRFYGEDKDKQQTNKNNNNNNNNGAMFWKSTTTSKTTSTNGQQQQQTFNNNKNNNNKNINYLNKLETKENKTTTTTNSACFGKQAETNLINKNSACFGKYKNNNNKEINKLEHKSLSNNNNNNNYDFIDDSKLCYCGYCNMELKGSFVLAKGRAWCPEHFCCANSACAKPLMESGFVEDPESRRNYCPKCYEVLLAPICFKCSLPLNESCINALGEKWHPECFCCTHCRKPVGVSSFFVENGKPYCDDDWNHLFTTKCVDCKGPIKVGQKWLEALGGQPFHADCFKCSTCKTILDGKIFFERQNRPYCRLHAIKAAIADSQKTTK